MKPRWSSRYRSLLAYILLCRLQFEGWQARASKVPNEERYYHHEVHLDENKHNDEFFSFVTRPDLDAPRWDIEIFKQNEVTPGYWFSAPYANVAQSTADAPWNAPHIYDGNGDLIWSGAPLFDGFTTFDFRVVDIQGKPMLSLVYPRGGKAFVFDDAYQIQRIVDMGDERLRENELALNSHEFTTADHGTKALYLTRLPKRTSKENSKVVDFNGNCYAIFDGIQELDTTSWESTNTWTSEGRIGLDESYVDQKPINERCGGEKAWEFFHSNSIDVFPNGDYLVSGRRTNAIYRISRANGSIVWRLGGRKSDFQVPLTFSGQHSARIFEQNDTHVVISLLDNAFLPPARPQTTNHESRGLILAMDTTTMTVSLVSEFSHPEGGYAKSRGNMQMLPSKNAWICWANGALQSEHTIDGSLVMKARFKADISSYRTYKFPWIGRPAYPPDLHAAVIDKNGQWYTIVHMSWNGATEVREWNIYHTDADGKNRTLVSKTPRRGFETSSWTEGYATHVVAEALDGDGVALGVSNVFKSLPPHDHNQPAFDSSSDSDRQSWIWNSAGQPPMLFAMGVVLGVILGVVASVAFLRCCTAQTGWGRGWAWWKHSKTMYEPLVTDQEEESFKSEPVDDDGKSGRFQDENERLAAG